MVAITKDPTRAKGLRVLMGPFTVCNKDNVEAAASSRLCPISPAGSPEAGDMLNGVGVDPALVRDVVLTHMHFDHAGSST